MTTQKNPLLTETPLPLFNQIQPEHIEPAVDQILAENRLKLQEILKQAEHPTWENLIQPLEELGDRLNKIWSPVSHMHSVISSEPLRNAYNACLPKLTEYYTELGQNEQLYQAYNKLTQSEYYQQFDTAQKKLLADELRDFRLAGIGLPPEQKKRYQTLQQRLSKLSTKFEEHLLDATDAWHKAISDVSLLTGIPERALAAAELAAQRVGKTGWLLTLDFPSYDAVIRFADNRELRQEIYTAYVTRASDQGPQAGKFDNSNIMQEILTLRHELAQLLGFRNFAELSLATKMAKKPQQVIDFLNDLAIRSKAMAQQDYAELRKFAATEYGVTDLQAWDIPYYSEKLRRKLYDIDEEQIRAYFPVDRVLAGLFNTVQRLYGLNIVENFGIDTWHPDVRFFHIYDETGELRGRFYIDLFARPQKRSGAWMDDYCGRRLLTDGSLQIPVAYLTCNFAPGTAAMPALLSHEEVLTLFHEFGHGLHHMLTRVNYAGVAGINGVPWDAVEFPSQFMEYWCWEKEALNSFAAHYQTNEPIPDALLNRMQAARNFQSGLYMLRQLEFSLFDFRLHLEFDPQQGNRIQQTLNEVRQQIGVIPVPEFNRFQHSFAHIFSGGYAAGYYSYKWAEVLAADAFSKFEEDGVFNANTGRAFLHTILEKGGSQEPMDLFIAFRGREPKIDALLRHNGISF